MRNAKFVAMGAILGLVVTACSANGSDDESPVAVGTAESDGEGATDEVGSASGEADPDAKMTLIQTASPGQWDPDQGRSTTVDFSWMSPVYDRLLRVNGDLELEPMLATEWDVSEDGLVYTVTLREGVEFHDGEPFNADAVVTNLERTQAQEGTLAAGQLENVESVEATDEFTIDIQLGVPNPTFPYTLALNQAGMMISPAALEDPESLATDPVGAGPYTLSSVGADRASYEKFEGYWDEERVSNAPSEYELIAIPDDSARLNTYRGGEADGMSVYIMEEDIRTALEEPDNKLINWPDSAAQRSLILIVNTENEALGNPQVRQALNMAFDRQSLQDVYGEESCRANDLPFKEPYASPELASAEYDPETAQQMLADAGYEDLSLSMVSLDRSFFQDAASIVQSQLAEIGVEVSVDIVPGAEALGAIRGGDYDLGLTQARGYPDPALYMEEWYQVYSPGGTPDELTQIMDDASQLPLDSDEREQAYADMMQYLDENPLHIILCEQSLLYMAKEHLLNTKDMGWSQLNLIWDAYPLSIAAEGS